MLKLAINIMVSLTGPTWCGLAAYELETAWRKDPEYQGGFTLDGGVHFVAGTRFLLGEETKPTAVSAFTTQLQPHLPPVDTINSICITKSGISGTYSNSFGTTFSGDEYTVACEKGTITIIDSKATVTDGEQALEKASEKEFPDEDSVRDELAAWAQYLVDGVPNPRQSPEGALVDLETLEKMLRSGEAQGKVETYFKWLSC
jgi:predicted dehydrogenase